MIIPADIPNTNSLENEQIKDHKRQLILHLCSLMGSNKEWHESMNHHGGLISIEPSGMCDRHFIKKRCTFHTSCSECRIKLQFMLAMRIIKEVVSG